MTLDDLESQFTALSSNDQTTEAIYLGYLHIKFDDEIKGNRFEFQAYFTIRLRPKLK